MDTIQTATTTKKQERTKAIALTAMCLALFMTNLDDTVMNVALPQIQTSLDTSLSGLQWILNAYTLPIASLVLPSGIVGDLYGRKRVFLGGLTIFTVASLICGFAPNLVTLIVGRSLQGVGAAALLPSTLTIITHTFPDPQEKTKAIGIWSAVSGLALIAGPALGGWLVDTFSWQSVFFLNLPLGILTFWVTFCFVKEVKHSDKQHLDVPGALLIIVFLASLTWVLIEGNEVAWSSSLMLSLLAIAGLSFLAFLVVESRSRYPMLPLHLFQNPTFAVANIVQILVYFTLVSLLFIFSLFFQQVQGYSAVETGLRFLPFNAIFIVALILSGWFSARVGWRFAIAMGLTLASVATFSFIHVDANTEYGTISMRLILSGFGAGLSLAPLTSAAMSSVPPSKAGIASALLNTSTRLGGVLGIAIQGMLLAQGLASELARSLKAWNLPADLQQKLITNVLHHGTQVPDALPGSISATTWQQAFRDAFVSGFHTTILVASVALLVGALAIAMFIPSKKSG